jgi:hypothetical protein
MSSRWGDAVDDESAEGEAEAYEVLPETQVRVRRRWRRTARTGGVRRRSAAAAGEPATGSPTLKPVGEKLAAHARRRSRSHFAHRTAATRTLRSPARRCAGCGQRRWQQRMPRWRGFALISVSACAPQVIGPDKHGIKTIIEFKVKEDGTKARRLGARSAAACAAANTRALAAASTRPQVKITKKIRVQKVTKRVRRSALRTRASTHPPPHTRSRANTQTLFRSPLFRRCPRA